MSYAYAVFCHSCCKSEHRGFKKAEKRDSASLGIKDFKRDYAKDKRKHGTVQV
jgi:hypothetical protein